MSTASIPRDALKAEIRNRQAALYAQRSELQRYKKAYRALRSSLVQEFKKTCPQPEGYNSPYWRRPNEAKAQWDNAWGLFQAQHPELAQAKARWEDYARACQGIPSDLRLAHSYLRGKTYLECKPLAFGKTYRPYAGWVTFEAQGIAKYLDAPIADALVCIEIWITRGNVRRGQIENDGIFEAECLTNLEKKLKALENKLARRKAEVVEAQHKVEEWILKGQQAVVDVAYIDAEVKGMQKLCLTASIANMQKKLAALKP